MQPHITRGAFLVVHNELDLVDVAYASAANDEGQIKEWFNNNLLSKASEDCYAPWRAKKVFFQFLIVQPFVVAKMAVSLNAEEAN